LFKGDALGTGTGGSKKEAEQRAASATLEILADVIEKFSS